MKHEPDLREDCSSSLLAHQNEHYQAPQPETDTLLGFKLNPLWTNAFHPASKQTGQVRKGR